MTDSLYDLVDYSHITYDKSSLNAINVECIKYELNPIFRKVTLKEILDIGKKYLPENWSDDIENIKKNYKNIIQVVHKYDTVFLVFKQDNYFSLFDVKVDKPFYGERQYQTFTFLFPFKLDLEFKILTDKNENKNCKISVYYDRFLDYFLFNEKEESDTLALRSQFGLNYVGRDEIQQNPD